MDFSETLYIVREQYLRGFGHKHSQPTSWKKTWKSISPYMVHPTPCDKSSSIIPTVWQMQYQTMNTRGGWPPTPPTVKRPFPRGYGLTKTNILGLQHPRLFHLPMKINFEMLLVIAYVALALTMYSFLGQFRIYGLPDPTTLKESILSQYALERALPVHEDKVNLILHVGHLQVYGSAFLFWAVLVAWTILLAAAIYEALSEWLEESSDPITTWQYGAHSTDSILPVSAPSYYSTIPGQDGEKAATAQVGWGKQPIKISLKRFKCFRRFPGFRHDEGPSLCSVEVGG